MKRQRREQRTEMVREMFGSQKTVPSSAFIWVQYCDSYNFVPHSNPDSGPQKKDAIIRHETQIHILNLLITSLELKTPNLALYLLGYEVKKPVSSTNLQDPGRTTVVAFGILVFVAVMIFME